MVIKLEGRGSESTHFRHKTKESAEAEAKKMSDLHKAVFVILEATSYTFAPVVPVTIKSF